MTNGGLRIGRLYRLTFLFLRRVCVLSRRMAQLLRIMLPFTILVRRFATRGIRLQSISRDCWLHMAFGIGGRRYARRARSQPRCSLSGRICQSYSREAMMSFSGRRCCGQWLYGEIIKELRNGRVVHICLASLPHITQSVHIMSTRVKFCCSLVSFIVTCKIHIHGVTCICAATNAFNAQRMMLFLLQRSAICHCPSTMQTGVKKKCRPNSCHPPNQPTALKEAVNIPQVKRKRLLP